ncbi:uncharacterized protein LOC144146216 [Haemaphysalis longicornis]
MRAACRAEKPSCSNCGGPHAVLDHSCPLWREERRQHPDSSDGNSRRGVVAQQQNKVQAAPGSIQAASARPKRGRWSRRQQQEGLTLVLRTLWELLPADSHLRPLCAQAAQGHQHPEHRHELSAYLLQHGPDVVAPQESYVRAGEGSELRLPGYTGYHSPTACDNAQCSLVVCSQPAHPPGPSRASVFVRDCVQHAVLDTREPEENTSEFGVFDGASSIISLGLDDSDRNLASESVQMTTLQSASSEERGDPGVVGVQRARRVSWPCSSTQAVVAAAAVFQGMLILITLTAINKYGLFDGSSSGDNNDLEQVKYYDKPDIQQPERSGAEDYDDGPGALERMQGRAMASGGSALALATPDLGADADTVNRAGDASQTAHSPSSAGRNTSGRVLMCLFADSFEGDFPAQLCTHLVFMNAVIDLQAQLIRPNSAEQGRAVLQRFINQRRELEDGGSRFLVSLWEARVTDTYRDLFTDWSRGTRAATLALGWLQRTGLDGLALLNLAVSADSGPDFLSIFKVLRTVMGRDVTLVFGFYLAGIPEGKEETRLVRTLHQIAKFVNFTVFETHDPRPVSCKVFVPNAYQKRADDLDAPGNTIVSMDASLHIAAVG